MADLEHGLTIHELELAETISGDSFVAIDDGTNTKKAKIANLNSASATSAQTYAEAAAASAASSASSATQAQTSAQSIQSAMVQATSQLQGYVDDAAASASSAAASEANIRGLITSDYAKLARSYATGDSGYREGEETDNAKYYSEQSESYVDSAEAQAVIAGQKADLSEDYAEESEDHALESEGHALGTQNGTPVSSDSPYYHNNAKYWADEARQSSAGGVAASVIATAEPTNISSHAYAIGDQFVYNGILYTATSAISVGSTITPGTNCSISDTITEQIGNAGHTILDEDGVTYPQRSKLQFEGAIVTDDAVNGITVVTCEGGGGSKISISTNETTLYGKTVTVTGTSETKTATIGNDGKAVIDGFMDTGSVTISASDGTDTATVTISIPYFGNYAVSLSFWAATLSITTDSPELYGQTVTVKDSNNQTVATATMSAQGACTATVSATGTYTVSAVGDGVTVTESVSVSAQTTYNVSLHLWTATVSISTTSSDLYGQTITVKKGGSTVGTTSFSAQGSASYSAHETGEYTFECTYSGQTYSDSVTVSAETSYTAEININITITVTLYSAAADTVSFTDLTGAKTVTTDNDGKAENVNITITNEGSIITFASSVAKDPENLSNDYSKSVTVAFDTDEIYLMPEHTLYWYGYENCTVELNGYKPSWTSGAFTTGTMTKGTNYMTITGASGGYCSFWLMPAVSAANLEKFKAIASSENGDAVIELANDYINNYTISMVNDAKNDIKSYEMVSAATKISGYSGTNIYCKGYVAPSKTITAKAFWYE